VVLNDGTLQPVVTISSGQRGGGGRTVYLPVEDPHKKEDDLILAVINKFLEVVSG
jgi:hypothetical protein